MGAYINPREMTKEKWLEKHGRQVVQPARFSEVPDKDFLVCLVFNTPADSVSGESFSAAAIAYDADEFRVFVDPDDPRRKRWYLVEKILARGVSDVEIYEGER